MSNWDAVLRDSTRNISELSDNVSKLLIQQRDVEDKLGSVNAFQTELSTTLSTIENNIDLLFSNPHNAAPTDADIQREQAFQTAINVDHRLNAISNALTEVVGDLNASQENTSSNGSLNKIVQILNAHHKTLSWLENSAVTVENELRVLNGGQ